MLKKVYPGRLPRTISAEVCVWKDVVRESAWKMVMSSARARMGTRRMQCTILRTDHDCGSSRHTSCSTRTRIAAKSA